MSFFQSPPRLANQFLDDRMLRSYLKRVLPREIAVETEPLLDEMGRLAAGPLYALHLAERTREPQLTAWDAWGRRVDRVETTALWQEAGRVACTHGLVAIPYERKYGAWSRVVQQALMYLYDPSTDIYTCPAGAADGAATVLYASENRALIERALPRLTSRDPRRAWTSGQWMTERAGGSDVGRAETIARRTDDGWRLYGTKWFCSTVTSEMALALARPDGNRPGGRGLALFYVETRTPDGAWNGITINRLKEKLGSRHLPTAELTLDGTVAVPVCGLEHGTRHIAPMLNIARLWNAVGAVARMRRGLALARDYARRREAFGRRLLDHPLHAQTLALLQAELEAYFHLAFFAVELLGADEAGALDDERRELLRLLVPVAKLVTTARVVSFTSEVLEAFGGAGYIEDTGLPMMLRDAQLLPIWEGTTNVLALDVLRVLAAHGARPLDALAHEVAGACAVGDARLAALAEQARKDVADAARWLAEHLASRESLEAGAKAFALVVGQALAHALLIRHADWALRVERDARPAHAALAFRRPHADTLDAVVDAASRRALAADDVNATHADDRRGSEPCA